MPAELTADAVGDGGDKFPAQTQVLAQVAGELLGAVARIRHVPLELIHQTAVAHVDVKLKRIAFNHFFVIF